MDIRIIREPISRAIAKEIAAEFYGDMVKGVVDIERGIIALGGEYHIDANAKLIDDGSQQNNIWGFNFYPGDGEIEYAALINIRPTRGNRVTEIQDGKLRAKMKEVIKKLIV